MFIGCDDQDSFSVIVYIFLGLCVGVISMLRDGMFPLSDSKSGSRPQFGDGIPTSGVSQRLST